MKFNIDDAINPATTTTPEGLSRFMDRLDVHIVTDSAYDITSYTGMADAADVMELCNLICGEVPFKDVDEQYFDGVFSNLPKKLREFQKNAVEILRKAFRFIIGKVIQSAKYIRGLITGKRDFHALYTAKAEKLQGKPRPGMETLPMLYHRISQTMKIPTGDGHIASVSGTFETGSSGEFSYRTGDKYDSRFGVKFEVGPAIGATAYSVSAYRVNCGKIVGSVAGFINYCSALMNLIATYVNEFDTFLKSPIISHVNAGYPASSSEIQLAFKHVRETTDSAYNGVRTLLGSETILANLVSGFISKDKVIITTPMSATDVLRYSSKLTRSNMSESIGADVEEIIRRTTCAMDGSKYVDRFGRTGQHEANYVYFGLGALSMFDEYMAGIYADSVEVFIKDHMVSIEESVAKVIQADKKVLEERQEGDDTPTTGSMIIPELTAITGILTKMITESQACIQKYAAILRQNLLCVAESLTTQTSASYLWLSDVIQNMIAATVRNATMEQKKFVYDIVNLVEKYQVENPEVVHSSFKHADNTGLWIAYRDFQNMLRGATETSIIKKIGRSIS